MKKCINYHLISQAITYYQERAFWYVDADWTVPQDIIDVTKPEWVVGVNSSIGPLIGSGEQFFLSEIRDGRLEPGRYCCATPCFRDDVEDEIHGEYFFKVELIDTTSHEHGTMMWGLMHDAKNFMEKYGIECEQKQIMDSDHLQYDLIDKRFGIELGSYGLRHHKDIGTWIYGTGLAEPRFSIVMEKYYGA